MENTRIFKQEKCKVDYKQVVYLNEYIIYEQIESLDKYAIFKFYNNYNEKINAIEFIIKQYDENDKVIAENVFKYSNFVGNKQEFFVPYTKLMVEDECVRLEAILVKADFEKHHYSDCKLISQRDLVNTERGLKPSRKERNKVRKRKLKNKNKIRYFLLAPVLLAIFVLLTIYFYNSVTNYANNIREFSDNNFHYIVSGDSATIDRYIGNDTDIEIKAEIDLGLRKLKVEKIANNTFSGSNVESVNVSAPNITIEDSAFSNCVNLKTFKALNVLSVGKYAFDGCSSLEKFDADSVITIGESAFNSCFALADFDFNGTESINSSAFAYCSNLTSVYGADIKSISSKAFMGCESITIISAPKAKIAQNAFPSNLKVKEVNFGTVDYQFGNIFGLDNEDLPETLVKVICNAENVHRYMFEDITSKVELSFRNEDVVFDFLALNSYYTSVYGDKYFYNDNYEIIDGEIIGIKNANSVYVNNDSLSGYEGKVTSISPDAFASMTYLNELSIDIEGLHLSKDTLSKAKNLNTLTLGSKVTFDDDALSLSSVKTLNIMSIESKNYQSLVFNSKVKSVTANDEFIPAYAFRGMSNVTEINLPYAKTISEGTFSDCAKLTNINMPNVILTEIPSYAFSGCQSLTYFDLSYVTKIDTYAFANCEKLYVNLDGSYLTEINSYAFYNCDSISDIVFGQNVERINMSAFAGCDNIYSILFNGSDKLKIIENDAFLDCKNLTYIGLLPYSLEWIDRAFTGENNIKYFETYNLGMTMSSYGTFEKLEELRVFSSPYGKPLVSEMVTGLSSLKKLSLPYEMTIQNNVVSNCSNLEFIEFWINDGYTNVIGKECSNLKYVTINNSNVDFSYGNINESASSTVSLYINGEVGKSTYIDNLNNLETLCISNVSTNYFGQLFGAYSYYDQYLSVPSTLKNVEIGNSYINDNFFYGLNNIQNLVLLNPNYIGKDALTGLSNLKNIYFGTMFNSYEFIDGFNNTMYYSSLPNVVYESFNYSSYLYNINSNSYISNYGNRSYNVYDKDNVYLGSYNHIFVYSVEEIMSQYGLTGSLTFKQGSNTPAIVNVFSSEGSLFSFEPKPFEFKAFEQMPIQIMYFLEDGYSYTDSFTYDYDDFILPTPTSNYGFTFMGWYTDYNYTTLFELKEDERLTSDIALYAKFEDLRSSKIVQTDSIHQIVSGENHFVMSDNSSNVEVFIYSSSSFSAIIMDKNGNIVTYLNDSYNKHTLDLSLYGGYYIYLDYSIDVVYVSYQFSGELTSKNTVDIDIDNEKYYEFKFVNNNLENLYIPGHVNYKFLGWYDVYGNLIIDAYGNIYSYNSCDIYARWEKVNNN